MDLAEITKILSEQAEVHVCAICGTPYKQYHSRQKTCGSPECKREWHNQYQRERTKRLREENIEEWRKYHREAQRRSREKKRGLGERDAQLKDVGTRWEKQSEFDKKIAEYGHRYGEISAQKVLATVPKIDVNLGGTHDNVHDKDRGDRS